jgi:hypothetical protein
MKWSSLKLKWACYIGTLMECLRKTTTNLSQDIQSLGRDFNPRSAILEAACRLLL